MKVEYKYSDITETVIGAAMEVHSQLGCGFLESVYEEALAIELELRNITFERQKKFEIFYKGRNVKQFMCDMIVEGKILLELKALSQLSGTEEAQVLNYLKAAELEIGLLINFGKGSLKVRRFAN